MAMKKKILKLLVAIAEKLGIDVNEVYSQPDPPGTKSQPDPPGTYSQPDPPGTGG